MNIISLYAHGFYRKNPRKRMKRTGLYAATNRTSKRRASTGMEIMMPVKGLVIKDRGVLLPMPSYTVPLDKLFAAAKIAGIQVEKKPAVNEIHVGLCMWCSDVIEQGGSFSVAGNNAFCDDSCAEWHEVHWGISDGL